MLWALHAARKRVISIFGMNIFLLNVCNVHHSLTRLQNFFAYICRFFVLFTSSFFRCESITNIRSFLFIFLLSLWSLRGAQLQRVRLQLSHYSMCAFFVVYLCTPLLLLLLLLSELKRSQFSHEIHFTYKPSKANNRLLGNAIKLVIDRNVEHDESAILFLLMCARTFFPLKLQVHTQSIKVDISNGNFFSESYDILCNSI